jgi:hypothetical protein
MLILYALDNVSIFYQGLQKKSGLLQTNLIGGLPIIK